MSKHLINFVSDLNELSCLFIGTKTIIIDHLIHITQDYYQAKNLIANPGKLFNLITSVLVRYFGVKLKPL
jgi:hypothetical protein